MVVVSDRSWLRTNRIQTFVGNAEDRRRSREPDNAIRITIGGINGPVTQLCRDAVMLNLQQNLGPHTRNPKRPLIIRRQRACYKRLQRRDRQSTANRKWLKWDRDDRTLPESIESAARADPYIALAVMQNASDVVAGQTILLGERLHLGIVELPCRRPFDLRVAGDDPDTELDGFQYPGW